MLYFYALKQATLSFVELSEWPIECRDFDIDFIWCCFYEESAILCSTNYLLLASKLLFSHNILFLSLLKLKFEECIDLLWKLLNFPSSLFFLLCFGIKVEEWDGLILQLDDVCLVLSILVIVLPFLRQLLKFISNVFL